MANICNKNVRRLLEVASFFVENCRNGIQYNVNVCKNLSCNVSNCKVEWLYRKFAVLFLV